MSLFQLDARGNYVLATVPTFAGPATQGTGLVTLKAPPSTCRIMRMTKYSGSVVGSDTTIDDLTEITTTFPQEYTIFKPNDDRKIDCIKAVRAVTGWGLKDAKDSVTLWFAQGLSVEIVDFKQW